MLAQAYAPALLGMDGRLVSIECDITNGLPGFVVVGLGDKAVEEARERVRSAIKNSGLLLPPKRITLNLAPADLPKDGSGYDLGMAMAVLGASGQIDPSALIGSLFMGELALDGSIKPIKGAAIAATLTAQESLDQLFVATENAAEASSFTATKVFAVSTLLELYRHLIGDQPLPATTLQPQTPKASAPPIVDFSLIYGQSQAKRAAEIAAAGNHNLLLSGPPGTGKTLIAKAMMGILPEPNISEMIEITKIHSLAGYHTTGIMTERPFRAPHHTASSVALIGGGTKPRPGEISLSHGGVLFLDELPEFPRSVLEVLRQPLEEGSITVARAAGVITFPARFMLIATRNPCPCGYAGDPGGACACKQSSVTQYQKKISGPLLDRIDIAIDVPRLDEQSVINAKPAEPTDKIALRVAKCRQIQITRLGDAGIFSNAHMRNQDIQKYCKINNNTKKLASVAIKQLNLSARGYNRIIKVARTIADLEGSTSIEMHHFTEALQYRPRLPITQQSQSPKTKNEAS